MGDKCTKVNENVYFGARKKASAYNQALFSRDRAAELIGVSTSTLADYELGVTKVVPVDKVVLMADLYGAPELKTWYCKNECPIGRDYPVKTEVGTMDGIALRLLRVLDTEEIDEMKRTLINIASDGHIGENEKPKLKKILSELDRIILAASELKLAGTKILGN